jgi:hypothetical protein
MKRLEQDMQKMRNERLDLIKKLQQQKDESDKVLQKQIEFKDLENQFKSQELVELTIKYKCLESAVKKNPNSVQITNVQQQFSPQHHQYQSPHHHQLNGSHINSSNVSVNLHNQFKMSNLPQKRVLQHSANSDNDENEQPEVKRPTLAAPRPNVILQNKTNTPNNSSINSNITLNTSNGIAKTFKSSDQLTTTSSTSSPITTQKSEPKPPHALPQKASENRNFKRDCVLNTKLSAYYPNLLQLVSGKPQAESIFTLSDHVNDLANYLKQFNADNRPSNFAICSMTKFFILNDRLKKLVNALEKFSQKDPTLKYQISTRIDGLFESLNKELTHLLLQYFLFSNEHYSVNILMILISQRVTVNQGALQKTFRLFVDLACLTFDALFKLYLFRIENGETNATLAPADEAMTKEFYRVLLSMLKFINFSKLFGADESSSSTALSKHGASVINSDSCLSYLILKLFNSMLDCFNLLSSRRSNGHMAHPFGRESCLYSSLLDNLHNISNNKYVWYHFKSNLFYFIYTIFFQQNLYTRCTFGQNQLA